MTTCNKFIKDICFDLCAVKVTSEDPEEIWTVLFVFFSKCGPFFSCIAQGHPSRKHRDWFEENDAEIQKHRLHKEHQGDTRSVSKKAVYITICKTAQIRLRGM